MCLDAALRATHGRRRLRHIQAFERPQHEHLLLAARERLNRLFERGHGLGYFELAGRLRIEARRQRNRILFIVVLVVAAERQPGDHAAAHGAAPLHVPDTVLENPIEQRFPFFGRPIRIGTRKLQHRILDGVQCIVLVTQRRLGDLECLQFDAGQKLVQRTRLAICSRIRQFHVAV